MTAAVELFAGAGGLGLGGRFAGFRHIGLVDASPSACASLRRNVRLFPGLGAQAIYQSDVTEFDFSVFRRKADVLLAGAPCQPWSQGGSHDGPSDARNLFDEVIRALREIEPDALIIENVRGLSRPAFAGFLEYLRLAIAFPTVANPRLGWLANLRNLRRAEKRPGSAQAYRTYGPVSLNAADYGTAQIRHRVFLVALRSSLRETWTPPAPTHSREKLIRDLWMSSDYWRRHGLRQPSSRSDLWRSTKPHDLNGVGASGLRPWRTVRDAIADLPDPRSSGDLTSDHRIVAGARAYPGHTGSFLDWPAKTLKAGVHGVPGGENCVKLRNGRVRYFTIREAARLQDFPDAYTFDATWSQAFRQIGNAVPVRLSTAVAASVLKAVTASGARHR
jgi:DNA (cytosine-5)-methyltransferase 1